MKQVIDQRLIEAGTLRRKCCGYRSLVTEVEDFHSQ